MGLSPNRSIVTCIAAVAAFTASCTSAQQTPETADARDAVHSRLDAAAARCLEADIAALRCNELEDPGYKPRGSAKQVASRTGMALREKLQKYSYEVTVPILLGTLDIQSRTNAMADQAGAEISRVITSFREKIDHESLDRCHAACLVQCFTSRALTYDDEIAARNSLESSLMNPADTGPDYAAASGMGLCRNYTRLAEELGGRMGLGLGYASVGDNHAAVIYSDGGRSFVFEPQRDPIARGSCDRYRI